MASSPREEGEDPFRLQRFVEAQAPVIAGVLAELQAGRKTSHWMWFVFPQIAGLGHSPTARFYAIGSLAEAKAYLAHPLLGDRLRRCTELAVRAEAPSAHAIFGSPDDAKFRSSVTLFGVAAPDEPVFGAALERWYGGEPDAATLAILAEAEPRNA